MKNKGTFQTFILNINDSKAVEEFDELINDGWQVVTGQAHTVQDSLVYILFKVDEPDEKIIEEQREQVNQFEEGFKTGQGRFKALPWYKRLFTNLIEE